MTVVDNDHSGETTSPPEDKKSGGWLSSNMAQLMVFLNGLILTATAFATLNIFIGEIVYDSMDETASKVHEHIARELFAAERTLGMVASTISLLPVEDNHHLSDVSINTFEQSHIEQIYLLHREDSGAFTLGIVEESAQGEADHSLPLMKTLNPGTYLDYISGDRFSPKQAKLYTQLAGVNTDEMSAPLAIAYPIYYDGVLHDVLVGVLRLDALVDQDALLKKTIIAEIFVRAAENDRPLFSFTRGTQAGATDLYRSSFTSELGGQKLTTQVNILPGDRENFLIKIPLLMLLFGVTLTLIGTLYVRNNQRQSQKLGGMNRELAQKNHELSIQINEGLRLAQTISKNEREYRALVDSVSDIIFETAPNGDILFLNETWKRVTGFELDQSIRRNLFDMLYLQDQKEQRANFEAMVQGKKKSYRAFTRLRTATGKFRAVELAVSMLRHDDNNKMRIVGTITDVEERRRAERALAEAERKYREIVENAAGGIYQVTPEGIFLSVNPSMALVLGYDTTDQMLREVHNANKQLYADKRAREAFLQQVAASEDSLPFEAQMVRSDGQIIWVKENLRAVKDEQGMLIYYEGSLEEVTQSKEAELAMLQAKVESDLANRAKSEFLANMSHELRTPLNSIIGFSEIIKNESFGPLGKKEYWDYANSIFDSGKQLLNVINEILDVSRIQAGERQLNEGVVSVKRLTQSCIEMMQSKVAAGELTINNQLADTNLQLIGEAQAVKQMILNLLSNAVKFTPEGGMVTLSGEVDEQGQCRISVTDTGMGLSEEEIKKALSPFGQIDSDHNRKKSGTGLGLTLVNALISLHGGTLEMISQKGIGTTATLVFPPRRVSQKIDDRTTVMDRIKEDL